MKLLKIIIKNFKVLVRSKSSALVVIFGPLLLILLVGLAFSNSSSFTLNIGVYSNNYNELTESYLGKLANENYRISKFNSDTGCIENIKSSKVHTCIIFPDDFEITNNKTNEIRFYIDQTKQNFVYAVINTLSSSFVSRSSELSLDLTNNILDVMSRTNSRVISDKNDEITESISLAESVLDKSENIQDKLNSNSVDTGGVSSASGSIDRESKVLRNRISELYEEGNNLLNLSLTIVTDDDTQFNDDNKSQNYWEDALDSYDGSDGKLFQAWNESIAAKDRFVNATTVLTSSVNNLLDSIDDSKEVQAEVIAELENGLDPDVGKIKANVETVDKSLNTIIQDISSITISNAENIVSPITTSVHTVVSEKSHLDYLFPSLIVLLIMFMSVLLSSTLIIMEKNSKAFFRNFTTPTNDFMFVISTFLTSLILIVLQVLIVLGIAKFVFNTSLLENIGIITLLVLLIASVFILLGMFIGYIFNTEQTAMMGAISFSSLILLTSDLILPIENMPIYLQNFAKYNPFIVGAESLRKSLIFSGTLSQIEPELWYFIIIIVASFMLIVFVQQITRLTFFRTVSFSKRKNDVERPESIKEIFKLDDRLIKDDKELYRFVKRLSKHDFKKLVYKKSNRVADFAFEVLKDEELSTKLLRVKTKWGILKTLENYQKNAKRKSKPKISISKLFKFKNKGRQNDDNDDGDKPEPPKPSHKKE